MKRKCWYNGHILLEINYLVTLQTFNAFWWKVCRVPITLSSFNERPHDAPRKNASKQQGYVYNVRTNHPYSNICCREIKEKPVIFKMSKFQKIFLNKMQISMSISTSYSKANLQETNIAVGLEKPVH